MSFGILRPNDLQGWGPLGCELEKPYMRKLDEFLSDHKASGKAFYPPEKDIFKALRLTPLEEVKVVILGQDPYYRAGQATGLAFAVPEGVKLTSSLQTIFGEVTNDYGVRRTKSDLTCWADQGVLLLNSFLTVRDGEPGSHRMNGWWQRFTDQALELVSYWRRDVVFCLLGKEAQRKKRLLVDSKPSHIMSTSHPSPQAAWRSSAAYSAFRDFKLFSNANRLLGVNDKITW